MVTISQQVFVKTLNPQGHPGESKGYFLVSWSGVEGRAWGIGQGSMAMENRVHYVRVTAILDNMDS